MTDIVVPTNSPFDTIRQVREDGTEYWSARDLMPLLGYQKWERFEGAVERAITAGDGDLFVQDVARLFAAHGINIGRNRLYEWLRENRWVTKGTGRNGNQPTQRRIEQGLVRPKVQAIHTPAGHTIEAVTTLITGKGREDLINGFLNGSYTI